MRKLSNIQRKSWLRLLKQRVKKQVSTPPGIFIPEMLDARIGFEAKVKEKDIQIDDLMPILTAETLKNLVISLPPMDHDDPDSPRFRRHQNMAIASLQAIEITSMYKSLELEEYLNTDQENLAKNWVQLLQNSEEALKTRERYKSKWDHDVNRSAELFNLTIFVTDIYRLVHKTMTKENYDNRTKLTTPTNSKRATKEFIADISKGNIDAPDIVNNLKQIAFNASGSRKYWEKYTVNPIRQFLDENNINIHLWIESDKGKEPSKADYLVDEASTSITNLLYAITTLMKAEPYWAPKYPHGPSSGRIQQLIETVWTALYELDEDLLKEQAGAAQAEGKADHKDALEANKEAAKDEKKEELDKGQQGQQKPSKTDTDLKDALKKLAGRPQTSNAISQDTSSSDEHLKMMAATYKPTGTPHPLPQALQDGLNELSWCAAVPEHPPRDKKIVHFRATRKSVRPHDEGSFPRNMWRMPIDGRVFTSVRKVEGGAVLIDSSGSMSLTDEQIEEMMLTAPAAIVATYSATTAIETGEFIGALRVIAKDGRMVDSAQHSLQPAGGANYCDFPALEWLAQQSHPRIWVSDGYVIPTGGGRYAAEIQCFGYAKANRITLVPSAEQARDILAGIRRPNR